MITRKDFNAAAKFVNGCSAIKRAAFTNQPSTEAFLIHEHERELIAHFLANWFEQENSSFDRAGFLRLCGVKSENCPDCGIEPGPNVTPGCKNKFGCGARG